MSAMGPSIEFLLPVRDPEQCPRCQGLREFATSLAALSKWPSQNETSDRFKINHHDMLLPFVCTVKIGKCEWGLWTSNGYAFCLGRRNLLVGSLAQPTSLATPLSRFCIAVTGNGMTSLESKFSRFQMSSAAIL